MGQLILLNYKEVEDVMNGHLQTIIRFVDESSNCVPSAATGDLSFLPCIVCMFLLFIGALTLFLYKIVYSNNANHSTLSLNLKKVMPISFLLGLFFVILGAIILQSTFAHAANQASITPIVEATVHDSCKVSIDNAMLKCNEAIHIKKISTNAFEEFDSFGDITLNIQSDNNELYDGVIPGEKSHSLNLFDGNLITFNTNMNESLAKSFINKNVFFVDFEYMELLDPEITVPEQTQNLRIGEVKVFDKINKVSTAPWNEIECSDESVASVKFDENDKLTITALKYGKMTIKISVDVFDIYRSGSKSFEINILKKEANVEILGDTTFDVLKTNEYFISKDTDAEANILTIGTDEDHAEVLLLNENIISVKGKKSCKFNIYITTNETDVFEPGFYDLDITIQKINPIVEFTPDLSDIKKGTEYEVKVENCSDVPLESITNFLPVVKYRLQTVDLANKSVKFTVLPNPKYVGTTISFYFNFRETEIYNSYTEHWCKTITT